VSHRRESLASHVHQVLSFAINFEMNDPGLEGLALTEVTLSPDFQFADIKYAVPEGDSPEDAQAALDRAKVALRKLVAQKVKFKRVPELRFHMDRGAVATRRIEEILQNLKEVSVRGDEDSN